MKKLLIILTIVTIIYLCFFYVIKEANPFNWDGFNRMLHVMLSLAAVAFYFLFIEDAKI